jgi:hypothetical protein
MCNTQSSSTIIKLKDGWRRVISYSSWSCKNLPQTVETAWCRSPKESHAHALPHGRSLTKRSQSYQQPVEEGSRVISRSREIHGRFCINSCHMYWGAPQWSVSWKPGTFGIRKFRDTVRWSNFGRRDPKMGVFLQSTEATPCGYLLKWQLTPENPPLWTPCSW